MIILDISNCVAVIVPAYNAEGTLGRCLESLVNQTYDNIRVIVVDDGSKDNTGLICDEWKEKDGRISVIHQANQGSIAARKNGLLSKEAQAAQYITFCDSDDTMPIDSISKLVDAAVRNDADCVCGQTQSIRGKIKYVTPRDCFNQPLERVYNHDEIINDGIYLSCFGYINYPVCYVAKLYKSEIITKAFEFVPVVKFMGEDLNCTIHLIPMLNSLVLISDVVYSYYDGGISSRFMSYAFDDFLALYGLKEECAKRYFNAESLEVAHRFMNNEMMWITLSRFTDCFVLGGYKKKELLDEIKRVCEIETVRISAEYVAAEDYPLNEFANNLLNREYGKIWDFVKKESRKKRFRKFIKKCLSLLT